MPFKAYQPGITLIVNQDDGVWKTFLTMLDVCVWKDCSSIEYKKYYTSFTLWEVTSTGSSPLIFLN